MAGQPDAVIAAPLLIGGVVGLLKALVQRALEVGAIAFGVGVGIVPERREMGEEVVTERGIEETLQAPRPRLDVSFRAAAQHAGLVGEYGQHRLAEVFLEGFIVWVERQVAEAGHGLRIQQIARRMCARLAIVGAVVDAPNLAAGASVDVGVVSILGHQFVVVP